MTYVSETRPLLVDVVLKYEIAEMQMIIWMSGVSMKTETIDKSGRN